MITLLELECFEAEFRKYANMVFLLALSEGFNVLSVLYDCKDTGTCEHENKNMMR